MVTPPLYLASLQWHGFHILQHKCPGTLKLFLSSGALVPQARARPAHEPGGRLCQGVRGDQVIRSPLMVKSKIFICNIGIFPPHHCGSCAVSPAEVILARKSFSSKNSLGNFLSDQSYLFSGSQIKN